MNGITNIEYDLDWYDIQARQYDAIGVPGWNAIDPLSEKYYSISPYAYCGGNPVNFGDYDGRDYTLSDKGVLSYDGNGKDKVVASNGKSISINENQASMIDNLIKSQTRHTPTSNEKQAPKWARAISVMDTKSAFALFTFFANESGNEWSLSSYKNGSFGLATEYNRNTTKNTFDRERDDKKGETRTKDLQWAVHLHPDTNNASPADMSAAQRAINDVMEGTPRFFYIFYSRSNVL